MADLTGIGAVSDLIKDGIDKIWPDKTEAEKQQAALLLTALQGQLETNKAEAANPNLFVAGWRPFVGWVCGAGFATQYVVGPLVEWGAAVAGHPTKFPQLDLGTLMPMLAGMLGLGYFRSQEKINGINSGH